MPTTSTRPTRHRRDAVKRGLQRLAHLATVTSTGVNGETGATVGAVDVTGTSHTAASDFPTDRWTFTATANYNNATGAMPTTSTRRTRRSS